MLKCDVELMVLEFEDGEVRNEIHRNSYGLCKHVDVELSYCV